jgi:hydrogenase maturation protease
MQTDTASKILLLGLGNDILTDDAVGLLLVRQLRDEFDGDARIDVYETQEMGLALLDFLSGYREVVLVDAIQTGRVPPGSVHELDAAGLKSLTGRTPHFVGVGETLALGKQLDLPMPTRVRIFAVEVADAHTLGTQLTPAVAVAVPAILARLRAALFP